MEQPFFIVGTGRCGSTLLYTLLAQHPRIALTNEARVVDFLAFCVNYAAVPAREAVEFEYFDPMKLRGMVLPEHVELFAPIFRDHARAALEDFYRQKFADKQFTHWGDKLPSLASLADIQAAYPHAKFLALVRDPRDGWCSFRSYRERPRMRRLYPSWTERGVGDWSEGWCNTYRGIGEYLEHVHFLRYEDLVREPLPPLRAALAFLQLEGAEDLVAQMPHRHSFDTHGTARSPADSIGRWRAELEPADIATIESACGPLMGRYGYELSTD